MHNVFTNMDNKEGDTADIIAFKTAVRDSIMRRWSLSGIEPNSPLVLAAALDPRFKSLRFLTDDWKQSVREELSQLKNADCGNLKLQSVAVKEKESSTHLQKRNKLMFYHLKTRRCIVKYIYIELLRKYIQLIHYNYFQVTL